MHTSILRLACALALAVSGCGQATTHCPEPATANGPPLTKTTPMVSAAPVDPSEVAAAVLAAINAVDVTSLHARFSPELRRLAPPDALQTHLSPLLAARGRLVDVVPIAAADGLFELHAAHGTWKVELAIAADGVVAGLRIVAPPEAPPVARSRPAGLPFRGEWLVFWGGDDEAQNHHATVPSQRRAADLVKVDAAGRTHRGDGRSLTDYYAYGEDVLAMADGVVVTAVDGIPDSEPGELSATFLTGNLVVVRHDGDLHSAYAHLLPGSVKVRPGDRVRRGQVLGACGNSGHSSEPHLHVQFQDGPRFDRGWGVEAVFAEAMVVHDGVASRRSDYTFLKGDRVSPPRPSPRATR